MSDCWEMGFQAFERGLRQAPDEDEQFQEAVREMRVEWNRGYLDANKKRDLDRMVADTDLRLCGCAAGNQTGGLENGNR